MLFPQRQGCKPIPGIPSPTLSNLFIENIMQEPQEDFANTVKINELW